MDIKTKTIYKQLIPNEEKVRKRHKDYYAEAMKIYFERYIDYIESLTLSSLSDKEKERIFNNIDIKMITVTTVSMPGYRVAIYNKETGELLYVMEMFR